MFALYQFLLVALVLVPAPKNLPDERGYTNQTTDAFQKTFNELNQLGWRLKRIKGYEKDGTSRFDSEWHKPAELPKFWCHHDLDENAYEFNSIQYRNAGYVETLKSSWKVNGKERFWAVWEMK